MAKKKAMVAPPPGPVIEQTEFAGADPRLEAVLQELHNDRAYTVIRSHGNTWRVIFEGDYQPSTVKVLDGKWAIVPD